MKKLVCLFVLVAAIPVFVLGAEQTKKNADECTDPELCSPSKAPEKPTSKPTDSKTADQKPAAKPEKKG